MGTYSCFFLYSETPCLGGIVLFIRESREVKYGCALAVVKVDMDAATETGNLRRQLEKAVSSEVRKKEATKATHRLG